MGNESKKKDHGRREEPEQVELSDELAWRVHETAKGWISQVDAKSAAALAIEAAAVGFALALITNSDTLAQLTWVSRWAMSFGLALLFGSVFLSMLVLMPRIKWREKKPSKPGYLYFGHLRHWDKDELAQTLARNQVNDGQIAAQVITLSGIAWRKHALFQWSLYLLFAGIALVGVLYLALIVGVFPEQLGNLTPEPCPTGVLQCP